MDGVGVRLVKKVAVGVDAFTKEEYVFQFKLYKEFISIASIDKAWTFKSPNGILHSYKFFTVKGLALCLSNVISEDSDGGLNVEWAPFPNEVTGASLSMPSPSGSKLLAVRNLENDLATHLEIWGSFQLEKEIRVPQSMHGFMYADRWYYESFERYDIVNGVVEVDGVKDEAETGTTDDSAKEDPLLSLKQRSLVTDDVARAFEKAKMMRF
ncbi:hypothetical protein Tco_1531521 [Tanacetum coccineum]